MLTRRQRDAVEKNGLGGVCECNVCCPMMCSVWNIHMHTLWTWSWSRRKIAECWSSAGEINDVKPPDVLAQGHPCNFLFMRSLTFFASISFAHCLLLTAYCSLLTVYTHFHFSILSRFYFPFVVFCSVLSLSLCVKTRVSSNANSAQHNPPHPFPYSRTRNSGFVDFSRSSFSFATQKTIKILLSRRKATR